MRISLRAYNDWTAWSACSRTCGYGVFERTRTGAISFLDAIGPCVVRASIFGLTHQNSTQTSIADRAQAQKLTECTAAFFHQLAQQNLSPLPSIARQLCGAHGVRALVLMSIGHALFLWYCAGTCTASCDGGMQSRSRTITRAASLGGSACPETSQEKVGLQLLNQQCACVCAGMQLIYLPG